MLITALAERDTALQQVASFAGLALAGSDLRSLFT